MNGTAFGPDLSLTPSQEGLLRKALSSNNPTPTPQQNAGTRPSASARSSSDPRYDANSTMANGVDMYTSPIQQTPGSGQLSSFDESPSFLDYDLDDGTFDWDNSGDRLFGDLPGTEYNEEGEHHDKRKAASGEDDEEEGSSKRREGNDKGAKKPGRKLLTGEPTTKRKAQNRAAQRAFRERKERHLKDLETKVEELEKTSETTNHENGRLRAQVEKLNVELKEYRKRLSLNSTGVSHSPPPSATRSFYNSNGSDFQFAFPKFGDLPGTFLNNGSLAKTTSPPLAGQRSTSVSSTGVPGFARKQSSGSASAKSPTNLNGTTANPQTYQRSPNSSDSNKFGELSGLFSPSILENASRNSSLDYVTFPGNKPASLKGLASISSTNGQAHMANGQHASVASITNSPASSMSHALDSSCGTTPESSADSPDNRKSSEGNLKTISEETMTQSQQRGKTSFCDEWARACGSIAEPVPPMLAESNGASATSQTVKSPAADINGIDWFAQQNGGQFDPILFSDYRDPQDNILSNNAFGDFFNDAFPTQDFSSPYNTGNFISPPTKQDWMQQVDKQKEGSPLEMVPADDARNFIACDKLWDRVQTSKRAQSGQVDMDELCSQLKSKAKCSGKGAVIAEKDVDAILGPETPATGEPTDFLKMFS